MDASLAVLGVAKEQLEQKAQGHKPASLQAKD